MPLCEFLPYLWLSHLQLSHVGGVYDAHYLEYRACCLQYTPSMVSKFECTIEVSEVHAHINWWISFSSIVLHTGKIKVTFYTQSLLLVVCMYMCICTLWNFCVHVYVCISPRGWCVELGMDSSPSDGWGVYPNRCSRQCSQSLDMVRHCTMCAILALPTP